MANDVIGIFMQLIIKIVYLTNGLLNLDNILYGASKSI